MNTAKSEPGAESLFVWVVLAVAGLAATVWAGAALAAAVTGGGILPASLGDGLAAAVGLPRAPGDPAGAWPSGAREVLPGALVYWLCTVVVAVGVAAAGMVVVTWWSGGGVGTGCRRRLGVETRARLARPADLAPLIVAQPTSGRFILGAVGRRARLVATE
ncbi:MAG: type IV secretory system conjugative DNA transfer family protein, partial [Acidimicrobiales bacterium]